MPYTSGLCDIGCHEGTSPKNFQDKHLPTCQMSSEQCSCKCHADLDTMFKMSEMERIAVDRSGYVPDKGDYVMPTPVEIAEDRRMGAATVTVERIESPDPDRVPATMRRTFAPTATGRSGQGELEQQVDEVCQSWAIDHDVPLCVPKYISEQIAKKHGIREPSVGAIGAVFDRWARIGYAVTARKPVRFVSYTDLGREIGLTGCKEKARRVKARSAR